MGGRIFLLNYGCAVNRAEGEVMAGVLASRGFTLVDSESDADLVLVNTCGVKTPTENKILHRLKTIRRDKKIVVAGCLPKIIGVNRILEIGNVKGVIGPAAGEVVLKAVQAVLNGGRYIGLEEEGFNNLLPCLRENPVIRKIVISQGCVGACSYCATRFARGRLRSYSIEEIVSAIGRSVGEGVREVWLSSQDNSVYGVDNGSSIVELLGKVANLEGLFLVRIGMMNPRGVLKHLEGIVEALRSKRFFKFIHIPLQSGSNRVLEDMNRGYSVEDFVRIILRLRREIPRISVETDLIVGYPTESWEDFEKTLDAVRIVEPDFLNISKFYVRPGTPASRLPKLPTNIVAERSRLLSRLALEVKEKRSASWVGWEGLALVDERGVVQGSFIARNMFYKPIVLRQNVKIGSFIRVRVTSRKPNFLVGEVVDKDLDEAEAIRLLEEENRASVSLA
ncbi:MAG: tRNA (N(6)-L-threonylcarbamoyladenosine(37)-C(2))-methylthiotransferase [Candidatus Brockarchaeota archaeon]|nr:tRNA (N(6)-L-threonylcarbamoyladenosine(37)-C(2))-methylthiotransferase [Candidatus Brockarchaeota archaeon]